MLDAGQALAASRWSLLASGHEWWLETSHLSQLELHAEKTASVEDSIESREFLDITDLGRFPDGSFDAVVCFGSPLSYVLGEADRALSELLRVTQRGGTLLFTVMSLLGTARAFFEQLADSSMSSDGSELSSTSSRQETSTRAQQRPRPSPVSLEQPRALLGRHPCRVITASAAIFLSARNDAWDERFLEIEIQACREPGALDGGTHIVVALERT